MENVKKKGEAEFVHDIEFPSDRTVHRPSGRAGPPGQVNDGSAARGILHQFDPEGNPFLKGFSLAIMKLGCPL